MDIFKNQRFEIGLDLEAVQAKDVRRLFEIMRDCEECGLYPDQIGELEKEVWKKLHELLGTDP